MAFGEYVHYIFEITDFKNPDLDLIDKNYSKYIMQFLNCGIDFRTPRIYKEYEFENIYSKGIID